MVQDSNGLTHNEQCSNRFMSLNESNLMVQDFFNPNKKGWMRATIQRVLGNRHYLCLLESGRLRKCNVEQMIECKTKHPTNPEAYEHAGEAYNSRWRRPKTQNKNRGMFFHPAVIMQQPHFVYGPNSASTPRPSPAPSPSRSPSSSPPPLPSTSTSPQPINKPRPTGSTSASISEPRPDQ